MTKILALGDSHILCFRKAYSNIKYTITAIPGATAQGAVNPNSKTNALKEFTKSLKSHLTNDYVCVQLGEVDCGFLIWYRAKKHNISIEDQLQNSLSNYEQFLKNTLNTYYKNEKILVLSAPLPTIEDNTNPKFLTGARSTVTVSLRERTDLTIEYNTRLSNICKTNNYIWIDITSDILNKKTKLVDEKWKNLNPYDHHLNPDMIWKLYEQKIKGKINV